MIDRKWLKYKSGMIFPEPLQYSRATWPKVNMAVLTCGGIDSSGSQCSKGDKEEIEILN
jgi:hypothetical protein